MSGPDIGGRKESQKKRSTLRSRNIKVRGRRTSMRLERQMWQALHEIAQREGYKIHDLCPLFRCTSIRTPL